MKLADRLDKNLYKVSNPERYIGNEWNSIKKEWTDDKIKIALAFPDVYEIGMSHLGLKILYHLLNESEDIICERTYAPWFDMEELMRKEEIPLFTLENKHSICDFDIFAFTLQYEMSYTNIINMLDLAGIPLYSKDRDNWYPLIMGGGSTVYNPEPVAPFFDLFFIGEAEEGIEELVRRYKSYREKGYRRENILEMLSELPGVYIPSLYEIEYNADGDIDSIRPKKKRIKKEIKKQIISNFDDSFYPVDFIVPYMDIVHNRAVLEIARGCSRGCRFCAAGMTYRPVRERSKEILIELADRILASTGYDELSLTSLSTVDYSDVKNLVREMAERYKDRKISISLSSLRVDQFSVELAREVQKVRKSGLTFAPEAGTQRLRDVINKGVDEHDFMQAVRAAFKAGWQHIKLYYMLGLPTEKREDIEAIAESAHRVLKMGREITGKRINVHVSISTFIPKPFTPFQWVRMIDKEEIIEKQNYLKKKLRGKGLKFSWDEPEISILEGVFSRGDRKLAPLIIKAWEEGSRFEGWDEYFKSEIWEKAFAEAGLDRNKYTATRKMEGILPWSHINMGISSDFLRREYSRALHGEKTADCRQGECTGCNICSELRTEPELVWGGDKNVSAD